MFFKNVRIFMDDLGLPGELIDDENILKLLTLLFPCTNKKFRPTECVESREMLLSTLSENNEKMRQVFFSDPLIRYLWNHVFMQDRPAFVSNHMRWFRSDPKYGEAGVLKFINCLRKLEEC